MSPIPSTRARARSGLQVSRRTLGRSTSGALRAARAEARHVAEHHRASDRWGRKGPAQYPPRTIPRLCTSTSCEDQQLLDPLRRRDTGTEAADGHPERLMGALHRPNTPAKRQQRFFFVEEDPKIRLFHLRPTELGRIEAR